MRPKLVTVWNKQLNIVEIWSFSLAYNTWPGWRGLKPSKHCDSDVIYVEILRRNHSRLQASASR